MNGYAVISDLNASYALRASALSSGLPLKRKSGFRNAAPPYFHFMILQRHNVVICSLTVRSHTPVCFDKSALFVRIRPPSSVIETSVNRRRKAAFNSLKFFTAVISNVLPPFPKRAPSRSFLFILPFSPCSERRRSDVAPFGCAVGRSFRLRAFRFRRAVRSGSRRAPRRPPRLFVEKNFISADFRLRKSACIKFYNTVSPFFRAHGFVAFLLAFFDFVYSRRFFLFRFRGAKIEKRKKQTIELKTKSKKAKQIKAYINLSIFYDFYGKTADKPLSHKLQAHP